MPSGWSNKENELLLSLLDKDNDNNYKSNQNWNQISQEMSRGVNYTNSVRTYTYGSVRAHWLNALKVKVEFQAHQEVEREANQQRVADDQAAAAAAAVELEEQNRVAQEEVAARAAEEQAASGATKEQAPAEEQRRIDQEQAAAEFAENQRRGQEILDTL